MNDTELDEMLNKWDAPPVRAELREKVRAGFTAGPGRSVKRRFAWPSWHVGKGLFAGVAAAAVLFMVVLAQALPQSLVSSSPVVRFPWVVQSNVVVYEKDGSSRVDANLMSFAYKGTEIVVTETHPANPLETWIMGFHNAIHYSLLRYVPGLVMPESAAKDAWFGAYVQAGCVGKGETVLGHETILDHRTTAIQHTDPDGWRGTRWRSPDLGCFALRTRSEEPLPGGGYRVANQRDALRVLGRSANGWHE